MRCRIPIEVVGPSIVRRIDRTRCRSRRFCAERLEATILAIGLVAWLGLAPAALAVNGTRAIAYGAASVKVAGSDSASGADPSQLDTNPANLARIAGQRADFGGVAIFAGDRHSDLLGNDRRISNTVTPIAALGYAWRVAPARTVFGVGLHAQGGAGSVYRDLRTPFGTQDEYASRYGVLLASVGFATEITDRLQVGASIAVVSSAAKQRLLPDTSYASPGGTWFGLETSDATATRAGGRIGIRYEVAPEFAIGAYFAQSVNLPLEGSAVANLTAIGLGKVRYASLDIDGLGTPREAAVGFAWRANERLEWSAKLERIFWSGVYRTIRYRATRPDTPGAPPELTLESRVDWRDQTVVAVGATVVVDADTIVRAGINWGTQPGRAETTSPLLSGIDRLHFTAGFSRRLPEHWTIFAGIEVLRPESLDYFNPEQPFGPSTLERRYVALSLALSRAW